MQSTEQLFEAYIPPLDEETLQAGLWEHFCNVPDPGDACVGKLRDKFGIEVVEVGPACIRGVMDRTNPLFGVYLQPPGPDTP
jgi:hypothetical protein